MIKVNRNLTKQQDFLKRCNPAARGCVKAIKFQHNKTMKKTLKMYYDAFRAVQNYCNQHNTVWQFLLAFVNAFAAFGVKIQSIETTEAQQEEDNKGVTRTKAEKKQDLANEATAIAQALQAFARKTGNNELYSLMEISYSEIMRAKASEAISKGELIVSTLGEYPMEELEPYGISDAVKETLVQAIDSFRSAAPTTRNIITRKTVLTDNLEQLVKEANSIMRIELIKIARQLKKTNPDFYAGLVANAKLINHTVHAKIRLKATDEATGMPVTGGLVTIEGTSLTGIFNDRGECTITLVPAGKRDVTISHANFETMVLPQVNFQRGHSITKPVALIPQYDIPPVKEPAKAKAKARVR